MCGRVANANIVEACHAGGCLSAVLEQILERFRSNSLGHKICWPQYHYSYEKASKSSYFARSPRFTNLRGPPPPDARCRLHPLAPPPAIVHSAVGPTWTHALATEPSSTATSRRSLLPKAAANQPTGPCCSSLSPMTDLRPVYLVECVVPKLNLRVR